MLIVKRNKNYQTVECSALNGTPISQTLSLRLFSDHRRRGRMTIIRSRGSCFV